MKSKISLMLVIILFSTLLLINGKLIATNSIENNLFVNIMKTAIAYGESSGSGPYMKIYYSDSSSYKEGCYTVYRGYVKIECPPLDIEDCSPATLEYYFREKIPDCHYV